MSDLGKRILQNALEQIDEQGRESRLAKPQWHRMIIRRKNLWTEKANRLYRKEGIESLINNLKRKEERKNKNV